MTNGSHLCVLAKFCLKKYVEVSRCIFFTNFHQYQPNQTRLSKSFSKDGQIESKELICELKAL